MLSAKVVSELGAQKFYEKSLPKYDGIEKLVSKKFDNGSQITVKNLHSRKHSI